MATRSTIERETRDVSEPQLPMPPLFAHIALAFSSHTFSWLHFQKPCVKKVSTKIDGVDVLEAVLDTASHCNNVYLGSVDASADE